MYKDDDDDVIFFFLLFLLYRIFFDTLQKPRTNGQTQLKYMILKRNPEVIHIDKCQYHGNI